MARKLCLAPLTTLCGSGTQTLGRHSVTHLKVTLTPTFQLQVPFSQIHNPLLQCGTFMAVGPPHLPGSCFCGFHHPTGKGYGCSTLN
ncbi:hypothetical protein B0H11DRAFT_2077622 [Mycena galericulata]|nr:hypothetical protein B0H11DRAFT_2077622 [Mycena galericulata]